MKYYKKYAGFLDFSAMSNVKSDWKSSSTIKIIYKQSNLIQINRSPIRGRLITVNIRGKIYGVSYIHQLFFKEFHLRICF